MYLLFESLLNHARRRHIFHTFHLNVLVRGLGRPVQQMFLNVYSIILVCIYILKLYLLKIKNNIL